MSQVPEKVKDMLRTLIRHIEKDETIPGDPNTYLGYKEMHEILKLDKIRETWGDSLKDQGLADLAHWTRNEKRPAITGLIVIKGDPNSENYLQPGNGYFKVFDRPEKDFRWWKEQIKEAKDYPWEQYVDMNDMFLPEEIDSPEKYPEGAKKKIIVNRYERDIRARNKCAEDSGYICSVCSFDFEKFYGGDIGKKYIHVHHTKPLSEVPDGYEVVPKDLVAVCPNCHAMIHQKKPALSVDELKEIILKQRRSQEE